MACSTTSPHGRRSTASAVAARRRRRRRLAAAIDRLAAGDATLLGLWGDAGARAHGAARRSVGEIAVLSYRLPRRTLSRVGAQHPPAIRLERAIRDLFGSRPSARPTRGPGSISASGTSRIRSATHERRADAGALRLPAGGRRRPAPDPGRPGACRHHRAGPFPLHRQRRDCGAAGAAARLRAQGHRVADGRRDARAGGASSPAAPPATARSPMRSPSRRPSRRRCEVEPPPRARLSARADGRAGAAGQSFRRHRRDLQRRLVRAHARAMRHPARAHAARGRCLLRPPADDGRDRARRRRARSSRRTALRRCEHCSRRFAARFPRLIELYDNTASLQDRTVTTGIVKPALARQFGAGGYVGRASGRAFDARAALRLRALRRARRSRCRCSKPATSMRGSGSASARSSRAWR